MSSEEFKAQGNQAFQAKDYEKAVSFFTQAIEASPSPNHILFSNRSAAYASLGQYQDALDDANKCVEINGSWAKGYNRVGAAHYGRGEWDEAHKAYSKALELDPANKMAKEGLNETEIARDAGNDVKNVFSDAGMVEKLKKNPKTAELMKDPELVAKVQKLQTDPKSMSQELFSDPRLMTVMGAMLGVDLGVQPSQQSAPQEDTPVPDAYPEPSSKPETNTTSAENAAAPEPEKEATPEPVDNSKEEADNLKQQANQLYKKRQFDEAIELYNKAWETFQDITYLNNRAAAEFEKGDYDATIETCENAVEKGRELRADYKLVAKSFARLGSAYLKKDDLPNAIKFFEKSLTEHRSPDVLSKLRAAEADLKKKEAEEYIDPEKAEDARLQGKDFFTKGDWPAAVKAYTEMINRAPKDARGYSNRAAALAKLMSFPDAVKDCDKAIELDPSFVRAYIRKATALIAMKDFNKAMTTLEEARTVDADTNEGKAANEINGLYYKASSQRFAAIDGETPEQTFERASKDPEVSAILQDPVMNSILQQARENPAALQEHMKNPEVAKKINILIAAGVIRTR
ncbi:Hsp90 cochaperone [Komagataella kurtzmanii]|nr:Hsp90 cochaperone [Komagataella kurtzmanii]